MWIAYVVAALVAMAAGHRAADHPRLEWWRRWDRGLLRFALFWFYLLHGLAGAGLVAIMAHYGIEPVSSGSGRHIANGALFGLGAAALLRLELSSLGLITLSPARAIFKLGLERLADRLDAGARKNIPRRLGDLQPLALCAVAARLFARYYRDRLAADPVLLVGDLRWLDEICARVLAGPASESYEDRAKAIRITEELRNFCEQLIVNKHDATINLEVPPQPPQP